MKPRGSLTRSPAALARMALRVARDAPPAYSFPFSRHDFTQHHLFTMLVLKRFLKTDYRGIVQVLADGSDPRRLLGLNKLPHDSTLKYAHDGLLTKGLFSGPSPPFSVLRGDAA